ncbi:cryptochrome/photolyase family protein [Rhodovulum sulfidophilum]|uniref:cryptochrome/photolyase family protein n=1 Tax=Rhodovulum sulfidophilum TaxID=35806 RepID=UPI001F2338A0|nr:deoxyribodipyrimidine photo-lyase [Rhodovulum sulfidophilum]MCE8438298.1 DNA photolyase family protein [Rhodovulum sulfidophilum]
MSDQAPVIWWVRRDLRLGDNAALAAAAGSGRPVVPLFIHDETVEALGAAAKWRLGEGVAAFARALGARGSRLILRRGGAPGVLRAVAAETGAAAIVWGRAYDPAGRDSDKAVEDGLDGTGIELRAVAGALLFEPWTVETGQGGFYKVYTPYWKAVRDRDLPEPAPAPGLIPRPDFWPASDEIEDWRMGAALGRGAAVLARHASVGEEAAQGRLGAFAAQKVADYAERRDFPAAGATSRLSEHLSWGEISPRSCWHAGLRAMEAGKAGAETFLKELVWREFAWHLLWHSPHIAERNWREGWDDFPWSTDGDSPEATAWKRGRTGIPFVDAAMREMYVTGTMHNRARMVAASWLTKNLMTHWRVGMDWFADHLTDWDPASNAMGWQWVAGSGPDAAPYFRIFNPETQAAKFDPDGAYRDAWIAEGRQSPGQGALDYFDAVPRAWGLSPDAAYPAPAVTPEAGRRRALAAYQAREG